ncbi:uncharacterized protein LOC132197267 [Neocloeon triangulifer]|uniref:uncharacterized protein LOC132197267 n=1 Tax=Neocloeon triangulifer TaxID=2078957 RepID=UPI00286FAB35|nr:uncharacterized protein LOC132197267 [Neocloeon triangulifer]
MKIYVKISICLVLTMYVITCESKDSKLKNVTKKSENVKSKQSHAQPSAHGGSKKLKSGSAGNRIKIRRTIISCCGQKSCSSSSSKRIHRKNETIIPNDASKVKKIIRNELNGPSKKTVVIGKKKYKFPPEKATYDEAQKFCSDQGMELTSIADSKEAARIDEYLNYIGLGSEPVFSSANEQSMASLKWGTGSPPGGPGDCLTQYQGALYNASCDQQLSFSCQEMPLPDGVTTPATLDSIADAVLNFVGGKNIVVPSEKANATEANKLCKNQGMELMSLDSITQLDSVQDFLGDIGLSTSTLMTSMKKVTDGGSNWLGDLASAFLPNADPKKDGDCMGLNSLGITGINCDTVSNFVCEAPKPKLIGEKGQELPFSQDLLNQATAFLSGSKSEEIPKSSTVQNSKGATQAASKDAVPENTEKSPDLKTTAGEVETTKSVATVAEVVTERSTSADVGSATSSTAMKQTPSSEATDAISTSSADGTLTTDASQPASSASSLSPDAGSTSSNTSDKTSSTNSTTNTTDDATLSLNTNFTVNGKSYLSPNFTTTQENASAWCNASGMALVMFETKEEYLAVQDIISSNKTLNSITFFTGMAKKNGSIFPPLHYCSDGYFDQYNKTDEGKCIVLHGKSISDKPCTDSRNFLCEERIVPLSVNKSLGNNYFIPMGYNVSQYELRTYCRGNSLADLAIIDNPYELLGELDHFIDAMGLYNSTFYLWMRKDGNDFPDKLNGTILPWAPGQPINDNAHHCLKLYNKLLSTSTCNEPALGICELKSHANLSVVGKTFNVSGKRYVYSAQYIRPIHGSIYCKDIGMQSLVVETLAEHQAILAAIQTNSLQTVKMYIGLKRASGTISWEGGANFDMSTIGWTAVPISDFNCGAYLSTAVNFSDCKPANKIACEDGPPKFEGLVYKNYTSGGSTYFLVHVWKSYDEARALCKQNGGDLVVFESSAEVDAVNTFLAANFKQNDQIFIGLDKLNKGSFQWINNASMANTNWNSGEPDPSKASWAHCASTQSKKWITLGCTGNTQVLCEMR